MAKSAVPVACPISRSTPGTCGHSRTTRYTGSPADRQADPLHKPAFSAAGRTTSSGAHHFRVSSGTPGLPGNLSRTRYIARPTTNEAAPTPAISTNGQVGARRAI